MSQINGDGSVLKGVAKWKLHNHSLLGVGYIKWIFIQKISSTLKVINFSGLIRVIHTSGDSQTITRYCLCPPSFGFLLTRI